MAGAPVNSVLLPTTTPVDLATTLESGQCFRWRRLGDDWTNVLDGDVVTLTAYPDGILVSWPNSNADTAGRMLRYLRLDDDLAAIQRRLWRHPRVLAGITSYPGLRLLRQDPWETLSGFILSSTSNIKRISRTMELIAKTFGPAVDPHPSLPPEGEGTAGPLPSPPPTSGGGGSEVRSPLPLVGARPGPDPGRGLGRGPALSPAKGPAAHAFPAPEVLAEAGEARLRQLGCGFRAPYLARAAQAVASGELPLEALRGQPYDTIHTALTELAGVGDKIADCVMLFALDRLEAFPADRWVRRALADWYGMNERASYAEIRAWALDQFGNDAGYANLYLFWQRRQAK